MFTSNQQSHIHSVTNKNIFLAAFLSLISLSITSCGDTQTTTNPSPEATEQGEEKEEEKDADVADSPEESTQDQTSPADDTAVTDREPVTDSEKLDEPSLTVEEDVSTTDGDEVVDSQEGTEESVSDDSENNVDIADSEAETESLSGNETDVAQDTTSSKLPRVVLLGDSFTSGWKIPKEATYPSVALTLLQQKKYQVVLVDASIANSTTSGSTDDANPVIPSALSRLECQMTESELPPTHVLIALGAFDVLLEKKSPEDIKSNIVTLIETTRELGAEPLLVAFFKEKTIPFPLPPTKNLKVTVLSQAFNTLPDLKDWADKLRGNNSSEKAEYFLTLLTLYQDIAKELDVPIWNAMLDDIIAVEDLNIDDGLHPNEEGHKIIAGHFVKFLEDNVMMTKDQNSLASLVSSPDVCVSES
ncbi:MAG: GDSL-type esterase/lipase family protein [Proteobacteria bacterium]|nr:GDSL-type esterase/lipase family protein [Pseudomonadota bacterium]